MMVRDDRLVEFSFASRFEADVEAESILRVARKSWSDNRRSGVTGYLRLAGSRIEQTVEGPSTVVLGLASRILTDRRHGEIVIRHFGPIAERRFDDWSVAGLEAIAPVPVPPGPRPALRLLVSAPTPEPQDGTPTEFGRAMAGR